MSSYLLTAHDLSMSFQHRLLFHIPALSILPQDAIYLSGQNGVGKTTLLKILAGIQRPTKGEINHPKSNFLQRLIGLKSQPHILYMHQHPYLFDTNVENNILYGMKQLKIPTHEAHQRLLKALRLIQLESLRHEHISFLSGGEKQKVAMARAWVCQPSILLMDESSANLDSEAIQIQKMMVEDLIQQGSSVVITSHQPNLLTSCCTQHWIIDNQRLIHKAQLNLLNKDSHHVGF